MSDESRDEHARPSRPRRIAESAAYVLIAYVIALVGINIHEAVPWTSHIFPVAGQTLDRSSLDAAWRDVEDQYVVKSVDGNVVSAGAEQGIINALHDRYGDRFSRYLTAAELKAQYSDPLNGQLSGGIGIGLAARCHGQVCTGGQAADAALITVVLKNQPADRSGIRIGDQLVSVDGKPLAGMGSTVDAQVGAAAAMIRGKAGSAVHLGVVRGGLIPITVVRADLSIPSVYSQLMGKTLLLAVTGFDTNTGSDAVTQLKQGLAAGATSVILDLRDDGGGYVTAAQTLASQFVAPVQGKEQDVVVRRGRLNAGQDPNSADNVVHDPIQAGGVALAPKLVVLVNGDTASAAEIVTACLHDYHRGTVVGVQTFGKGSVQQDFPLPDGSDLHLTVEKWYGPDGESIDLHGIMPDKVVPLPSPDDRYRLDSQGPPAPADPQLQAALAAAGN